MKVKCLLLTSAALSLGLVASCIAPDVMDTRVYAIQTGWQGKNFIKADGTQAKSEWVEDNGSWFYIKDNGEYASDEWIGNYYFKYWGYMAHNEWLESNGKWYYVKADGTYAWDEWVGNYYCNYWGDMAHDTWVETHGKWYYLHSDGSVAVNQWIGCYYVDASGAMLHDHSTPDGYYVDGTGEWVTPADPNYQYDTSLYGWNLNREQVAFADAAAKQVASEIITSDMTDLEKAREITKWIYANTIKDHRQSAEIYKKTRGDTAWAVFKSHRAACSGYVRAFKLLGKYAGLQVEIINEDEWAHQWNTVYLADEDRWIECDSQAPHYDHQRFIPKDFGFTVLNYTGMALEETYHMDVFVTESDLKAYLDNEERRHQPSKVVRCDKDGNCVDTYTDPSDILPPKVTYEELEEAYKLTKKWTKWKWLHLLGDETSFDESTVL